MCVPIEHLPDQQMDPPEEEDFDARMEAIEAEGERAFDAWHDADYPERS